MWKLIWYILVLYFYFGSISPESLFFGLLQACFSLYHRGYLYSCFKPSSTYSNICAISGLASNNSFGRGLIFLTLYMLINLSYFLNIVSVILWSLWIRIYTLKSLEYFIYQVINLVDLDYSIHRLVVSSNSNSVILS